MDELLKRVAEIRGMPASLVERSAKARADKTGMSLEAVLEEWLGESAGASEPSAEPNEQAQAVEEPVEQISTSSTEPSESASGDITTDDLLQLAADAKRMPPKLILSSATARATHAGSTLEAVLAEWAGVDLDDLSAQSNESTPKDPTPPVKDVEPVDEPSAEQDDATDSQEDLSTTAPAAAATPVAAVAAAAVSMDALLDKVAEVKGMPASLAKRSAEAKAKKTGVSLEAVLAEWAGVDLADVATSQTQDAVVTESTPAVQADAPSEDPEQSEPSTQDDGVEIIEPTGTARNENETVGLDAVPRGGYPRWLAAAFLLIPLLAVTYLMVSPNGPDCGSGGQLLVDPVTGEATNCDGSDYGETTADYFAAGGAIYAQCAACHSADGSGGVGPSFTGGAVLATFPTGDCSTHIEWVGVGTAGWPDSTYGANAKPVGGVGLMPGFANSLSEQQLAEVALFERVQFGGQSLEDAEIDCGLVEASAEG